ncbi:MAG: AI-2E family transporter [Pedobacter sp.]|jgi:predicted PurR-regulated permease PerM
MLISTPSLQRITSIIFFVFLAISGLYFARQFLIPLAISALLAMLLLPMSKWLEARGINHIIAGLCCVLLLLSILVGLLFLLSWQASGISENIVQIGIRLQEISDNFRQFIARNLGITTDWQTEWIKNQNSGSQGSAIGLAGTLLSYMMSAIIKTVLVFVYLFLFLVSRSHLKQFILMLVPGSELKETEKIISDASKVSQRYISGLGIMIVILWIMYGIGFSIVGVESALFFAVLCGLLEIVPFIGNLTGSTLTALMVISQGGSNGMLIGVILTYIFVQFIQTYVLEPLVVGSEVNINPLFTIIVIVLMEIIWGIAGMILAIPMLGIVKIICDHVSPLKPYGFLIGRERPTKLTIKNK